MRLKYIDYVGPGRDHAVIDGKAVLCDAWATRRLAENAARLSLGAPARDEAVVASHPPQQRAHVAPAA